MDWIRVGPPAGKGDLFFIELVVLIGGALMLSATSILAPEMARVSAPFLFIALAWHTGFQVSLNSTGEFVLTVFDVLVPLSLFLGLIGHWYMSEANVKTWFSENWKLLATFWAFCLWGLAIAIVRNVDAQPMLANLKSLLIYPMIMIILPWCVRSWKQLYAAVALLLALITERALDGLHQAITHQVLKFQTLLGHGHVVYRIDGDMAATNQYATYLLTGALIFLALVATAKLKPLTRWSMLAPLGFISLALLLTYSRGAWLGTAVALIALVLILRPRQAFAIVGVFGLVVLAIEIVHPGAGGQIALRANDYDHSIAARQQFQAIALGVIQHYPFGAGWGAWFALVPGGVQPVAGFPWYHDDYLQLATEIGVLGVLPLLAIILSVIFTGAKAARNATDATKAAVVAGLTAAYIGMAVQTGTDQFLWHADIAPHIWIVAGLVLSGAALLRADQKRKETIDAGLEYAGATPITTGAARARKPADARF
ncbi:MAG TPA: O-antigen ligase family protein [Chloroflexota bacterium]|jgi:O-antigen ligase|nr:O-antigen ligase family protein [Chloroflexota bacterium]